MKALAVTETAYLIGLVRRAQQNDSDAFAELYTLTYERQYAFACRYLHDERLAQDALQEAYIVVYQGLPGLREPKCFTTWLRSIIQRICCDMAGKRRRQPAGMQAEQLDLLPDELADPGRVNEIGEMRDLVNRLPYRERQAIIMRYFAEMELRDIAQAMDCSVSSVTRYLRRGYETLRGDYKKGG